MSTSDRATSLRPAPRALFRGLLDDAAVFPPGLAPLPEAVREHRALRAGPYADLVGPLLVPTSAVADLRAILDADRVRLAVALIARPGTTVPAVRAAADELAGLDGVDLVGVELAHQPGWSALLDLGVPLAVEVDRDAGPRVAGLDDLASRTGQGTLLRAKLRTQGTASAPPPDAAQLAAFLRDCCNRSLTFKLTGGLHHAVAGTYPVGDRTEEQHGVLNVLLATGEATQAAEPAALEQTLGERDAAVLAGRVRALDDPDVERIRRAFTSYGCCGVLDPITELRDLSLISEEDPDR